MCSGRTEKEVKKKGTSVQWLDKAGLAATSLDIHCENTYRPSVGIPFDIVVKVDVTLVDGVCRQLRLWLTPWPRTWAGETHCVNGDAELVEKKRMILRRIK